jgi:hypothetical protein
LDKENLKLKRSSSDKKYICCPGKCLLREVSLPKGAGETPKGAGKRVKQINV